MANYAAESERLWLQLLSIEEHLDDYHLIVSNEKAMMWSTRDISTGLEHTKQMLSTRIPTSEKPYIETYAILLRPWSDNWDEREGKPRMIGTVGAPRNGPAGAEIGYGLHPDYWGKGYMSEALELFIGVYWGLGREASRETLIAEIDPDNTASERVAEKLGFKRGELLKDCYQRASEARAGIIQKRDQRRWYLHRPTTKLWNGCDIGQLTVVSQ